MKNICHARWSEALCVDRTLCDCGIVIATDEKHILISLINFFCMNRKFASLLIIFASACSNADHLNINDAVSPESFIEISTIATSFTKGEPVMSAEDMGSIGVYCALTGSEVWSETTEFEKLSDRLFSISGDSEWIIDGDSESWGYESLNDKYSFLSYSPHATKAKGISSRIVEGELIVDYVVPSSSVDQPDLMYAEPLKNIYPQLAGYVPLNFSHALSCVSFGVVSSDDVKIKGIYIKGIVGDGSLSWDYKSSGPTWSLGDITEESFVVEVDDYSLDADSSAQVNTEQGYLMMIPQLLPNGAEVVLTLDSEEQKNFTIPIDSEWVAGAKYNYIIKLDDSSEEGGFIYDSQQLSNCYIINPTPDQETVIQIPIEDRINDFWKNYSGDNVNKIRNKSTTDDFCVDMVWHDFDEPFEFSWELVYDSDEKMAARFVVPAKFQTGNFVFVVSEITTSTSTGLTSISPLWSWHLWFTDYNPDAIAAANKLAIVADTDMSYDLFGYEGAVHRYVDAEGIADSACVWSGIYKDKFIMDRNIGERNEYAADYGAGAVYYEFGRKDPFPGNGALYETGGTQPSVRTTSAFSFIQSVEFHYDYIASTASSSGNWSDESAARLFSCIWFDSTIPTSGYDVGKSIFDPSPLGWRVPVSDTWSSFNNYSSCDDIASVGKYNYYGWRDPYNNSLPSLCGEIGSVWSANPYNSESGYCLLYSTSQVSSPSVAIITHGLPVRAIQE